jgi:hypothetical protein
MPRYATRKVMNHIEPPLKKPEFAKNFCPDDEKKNVVARGYRWGVG